MSDGEPVRCAADVATVVEAVDLGRVRDGEVLVTGSKGCVLGVWGLTPPERLAVLTLDQPITDVVIDATGRIAALTGPGECFAVELAGA